MNLALPRLRLDVTDEEHRFGFSLTEEPSGVRAVAHDLGSGLRAVKVQADDGSVEYAVCDSENRQLYRPAKSLAELRDRFGGPAP
jgi:hypothetical protein